MKMKTHSGLKKRVRVNAKGKLFWKKPCKNHLLSNKSKDQKASHRLGMPVHDADSKNMKKLLAL